MIRHRDQHLRVGRVAEELVDQLLGFRQGGAQFLHDAAHRLPIGDPSVQVFHPAFERLRCLALPHAGHALRHALHAGAQLGVIELGVFEAGLDVQQAGGSFHRQRRRRRGRRLLRLGCSGAQLFGQHVTRREQALQRLAGQRELLRQAVQAVHFATGHAGPGLLGGRNPLAGLGDQCRIEATQRADVVIGAEVTDQVIGLAHRSESRCLAAVAGRIGLGAEEKQVTGQPFGDLAPAPLEDAQLRQQPRRDALAEHIGRQQALRLRLEHRCGQLPERAGVQVIGAGTESGKDVAHPAGGGRRRIAHDRQHPAFDGRACRSVGGAGHGEFVVGQRLPCPVADPQVGRVHAVGAGEFLDGAVLRKHRQRRHRLAGEQPGHVIEHREGRALDRRDGVAVEHARLGDATLHRRFAGAQQAGAGRQAHQFERADALVDVLPRTVDDGRIGRIDIRVEGGL